jgi:hypothetical protein
MSLPPPSPSREEELPSREEKEILQLDAAAEAAEAADARKRAAADKRALDAKNQALAAHRALEPVEVTVEAGCTIGFYEPGRTVGPSTARKGLVLRVNDAKARAKGLSPLVLSGGQCLGLGTPIRVLAPDRLAHPGQKTLGDCTLVPGPFPSPSSPLPVPRPLRPC